MAAGSHDMGHWVHPRPANSHQEVVDQVVSHVQEKTLLGTTCERRLLVREQRCFHPTLQYRWVRTITYPLKEWTPSRFTRASLRMCKNSEPREDLGYLQPVVTSVETDKIRHGDD
ncbi:hypothetical protein RUM44_004458 [Polyplax serrata]|uniref:Uncharacterized protein n=1 Tax=Polyplax serrata TaxID=468196 RepID=A0ABR1B2W7_POLSC